MNITIIIVHWNTPESLKNCLSSLKSTEYEVIVVDNASKEKLDWIKHDFPSVILIENKINKGYAAACNQGVVDAKGDWVLFLNPDVTTDRITIDSLIGYAISNKLDAVSPYTNASYSKPVPTFLSLFVEFSPLNRVVSLSVFKRKTLFGGFLLIKSEVLKELSGWDERFFVWFEDSDLTKRLYDKNYKIGWLNQAIKHEGGSSFRHLSDQKKKDIFFHSMNIYTKKHFSWISQLLIRFLTKRYSSTVLFPEQHSKLSVTVPNMKNALLESFLKNNYPYFENCEIIIVSSALSKNIWDYRKQFPNIRFIPLEKNLGFAPTVNVGFNISTGEHIGTINDDIQLQENSLNGLSEKITDKIGSINPIILNKNGNVESMGVTINKKGKAYPITELQVKNDILEVDATNAAAVIYSRDALNKVGLFDERFGSYLEDIDLSLRLKKFGYQNVVYTKATVVHQGQATSSGNPSKKTFYDLRNWCLVILKNWSVSDKVRYAPQILVERLRNISGYLKSL